MITRTYSIDKSDEGKRVDQFLTEQTGFTRSEVQKWIKAGNAYRQGEKKAESQLSSGGRRHYCIFMGGERGADSAGRKYSSRHPV